MAAENPARRPAGGPAQWEISTRQEQEPGIGKLPDRRMLRRSEKQIARIRRTAQATNQAGPVMDRLPSHLAEGLRMGGRDDQPTSLRQGCQTPDAGKASHSHDDDGRSRPVDDSSGLPDSVGVGLVARSLRSPDAISCPFVARRPPTASFIPAALWACMQPQVRHIAISSPGPRAKDRLQKATTDRVRATWCSSTGPEPAMASERGVATTTQTMEAATLRSGSSPSSRRHAVRPGGLPWPRPESVVFTM